MFKIIQALMLGTAIMMPAVANAGSYTCGVAQLDQLEPRGRNDVVQTMVSTDNGWTVLHTLRNGTVIDRSIQYLMIDNSNDHKTQWSGRLNGYPMFYMVGEIKFLYGNGQPVYNEWLYKYNVLIMHSMALCKPINSVVTPTYDGPTS